jgi:membrane-bound lytic murein transglycosylase D
MFILAIGLASGCARTAQPPDSGADAAAAARTSAAAQTLTLPQLEEQAEVHFAAGERAFRDGNYRYADSQFQAALDVYLGANIPDEMQPELQAAFNHLFSRIHALGLESLLYTAEEQVSLPDEELPTIPEDELEEFRARVLEPLPEEPLFTIPIPDPRDNPKVEAALVYLVTERKEVIQEGLSRASRYMPMIIATLEEVGVPKELAWVPLIESLFKPSAYSRARAAGMWQFMSGTARLYGLRVDWSVDERRDPVRATRTAAIYLKDLYEEMGSWELALASYNGGKGRVARAIQRVGSRDFWDIAETRYLARETRDFVPKIFAAMYIGTDPERYGLEFEVQPALEYDEAVVDSITDLRVLADAAGTSVDVIQDLNPHLRAATPNVDEYIVYVPKGSKQTFETALAAIPPSDRVNFIEHRVSRGENLSVIAARYGTRVSAIQEVNNISNPRRLQIGQRLVIPVGEPGRYYSSQPLTGYQVGEQITYRVQRGDSLNQIANLHRTNVASLMDWNNLTSTLIYPGDRLIVYYGTRGEAPGPLSSPAPAAASGPTASSPAAGSARADNGDSSRGLYTVRRGDSFYLIAQRFGVTVDQLKRWNNRRGNLIHPGDKLVIYGDSSVVDVPDVDQPAHNLVRHTVRRGDAPYVIAQRYGVSLDSLLAANGLTRSSRIYPGDVLLVPGAVATEGTTIYTVRRGDTPAEIAQSHGVSLDDLLRVNGLTRRSVIYPGDQLTIPGH